MKKCFKVMLSSILVLIMLSSSACQSQSISEAPSAPASNTSHTHTYSSEWKMSEDGHWLPASCGHDLISDMEPHSLEWSVSDTPTSVSKGSARGVCAVCKYSEELELPALTEENGYVHKWSDGVDLWQITVEEKSFEISFPNKYGYFPTITEVLPVIHINTPNSNRSWATKYDRESKLAGLIDYVDATVSTESCDESHVMTDVDAQVKVRGNYTLEYDKKPIRIKFKKKQNLLGLHDGEKYKNWVLLAEWKDLSMTHNSVAYYLGNTILGSDGYYCTDFRNVEVYLDGEYWGVYLLVEQQEVKDGRTSLSEVEDDYTGTDISYFFEYDGYYDLEAALPDGGDPTFTLDYGGGPGRVNGYTLKSDIYSDAQLSFIQSYMNNVYKIAYQATRYDKYYAFNEDYTALVDAGDRFSSAEEAISACIDVRSLVDTYILNEIACDLDVDWSSFYMGVDMSASGNKKLTFEAPWDFDSCFGLVKKCIGSETYLYAAQKNNPWFRLVTGEEWFQKMVREKWSDLVKNGVPETALEIVKTYKELYEGYYEKNYTKWSSRLNGDGECVSEINSYRTQGQAADYLYNWLTARFDYLNEQWLNESFYPEDNWTDEGKTAYRYEAENAEIEGGILLREGNGASGDGYLGHVAGSAGRTVTFQINAEDATDAYLYVGLSRRDFEFIFAGFFSVTVNESEIDLPWTLVEAGKSDWHDWTGVRVVKISLRKGINTVVLTTKSSDATNLDYIELLSEVELN